MLRSHAEGPGDLEAISLRALTTCSIAEAALGTEGNRPCEVGIGLEHERARLQAGEKIAGLPQS
ncbi:MAG: hypothetical protein H0W21_03430 [Actinobacteria bacterium]|nr:hypothetical protein [Actinomycetota bacterium]